MVSIQSENEGSGSRGGKDNLEERENFEKQRHDARSVFCATSNQSGWDNFGSEKQELSKEKDNFGSKKQELSKEKGPRITQKVTNSCLVKELFKSNEEELSIEKLNNNFC